jgi:hypothetical protein
MTSNIGAEDILKSTTIGFASRSDETKTREQAYERMKDNLLDKLKKRFRPEFLNRIDAQVVFHPLTKEQIRLIVDLMLASVSKQLSDKEIKLEVTDAAKDFLGEKGFDEVYGARPLRRVIQNMIEDKLSEAVLREEFKVFDRVFQVKATVKRPKVIDSAIKAIKDVPDVFTAEKAGDEIHVFSTKSRKYEIEKILKEHLKEAVKGEPEGKVKDVLKPRIEENSYISYVVVDIKDSEIFIESRDNFSLPNVAVGAGTK